MAEARLIPALFTEREFETVRRTCRDADAPNPLRALDSASSRAEGVEQEARAIAFATGTGGSVEPEADTDPAPPPPAEEEPAPSLRVPLPRAPGKR